MHAHNADQAQVADLYGIDIDHDRQRVLDRQAGEGSNQTDDQHSQRRLLRVLGVLVLVGSVVDDLQVVAGGQGDWYRGYREGGPGGREQSLLGLGVARVVHLVLPDLELDVSAL